MMPWHIVSKHSECPKSKPHAVVKDSDGSVEGCHATKSDANDHMRALYANEPKGSDDMTSSVDERQLGGKPNPGTPKDKRLKENDGCPPGYVRGKDGKCTSKSTSGDVETLAWDGSPGRFTDEQYKRSCAACDTAAGSTPKEQCFEPHHDPGGALNRQGLSQAAGRIDQVRGKSASSVESAKRHLRRHYREIGEDPPESLATDWEALRAELDVLSGHEHTLDGNDFLAGDQPATGAMWRGVMVVEGTPTGDRREFAEGSIEWPDTATVTMPLQWQKESSHGGDHDVTVSVGRISRIWRDGSLIMGEGPFDTHADAVEAQRRMGTNMLNGCSINADDISNADIEYIWPESDPDSDDDGDILQLLFGAPDKILFHKARLRAVTLCDIPAFVEATLHIVDSATGSSTPAEPVAGSTTPNPRAIPAHAAKLSDGAWDAAEAESRLPQTMSRTLAAGAYAHVDGDGDVLSVVNCRFLHHEIGDDGLPGAANISACQSAIQALYGSRIPDEDKEGVYNHLAAHLRDAGIEPAPYEREAALVAHAWQEQQWRPPRIWFDNPGIEAPTPIIVSNDGRVYGLAAEWHECHIGFGSECVVPPRADMHERFMTGELTCENGETIAVGQITAGIGHAPLGWNANRAAEHYDNTEAAVADVRVGNCKAGIWVAGAIRPWAQAARVHQLRASGEVSPDWRKIGGVWKLVGLLTVNTSGFQVPKLRTYTDNGTIKTMVASGLVSVHLGLGADEIERRAIELAKSHLRRMVHAEDH